MSKQYSVRELQKLLKDNGGIFMFDDNNFGLNDYEITEQKLLEDSDDEDSDDEDSDVNEYIPNTVKPISEKQLCCLGHPIETGRGIVGFIVLLIGIFIILTTKSELEETALGCFIGLSFCITTLVVAFKIWLGGK